MDKREIEIYIVPIETELNKDFNLLETSRWSIKGKYSQMLQFIFPKRLKARGQILERVKIWEDIELENKTIMMKEIYLICAFFSCFLTTQSQAPSNQQVLSFLQLDNTQSQHKKHKFEDRIQLITSDSDFILVAFFNNIVKLYTYHNNKLSETNTYDITPFLPPSLNDGSITALEINKEDKTISIGHRLGFFIYKFDEMVPNIVHLTEDNPTSQINTKSYNDVILYKEDKYVEPNELHAEKPSISKAHLEYSTQDQRCKSSILRKRIARNEFYDFENQENLHNPSMFRISNNKRQILTYDSIGRFRILDIKYSKVLIDTVLNTEIVYSDYIAKNKVVIVSKEGVILLYSLKTNEFMSVYKHPCSISQALYSPKGSLFISDEFNSLNKLELIGTKELERLTKTSSKILNFGFLDDYNSLWWVN